MTIEQIAVENRPPVNKFSAPIPVNGEAPPTLDSKFKVSRGDRLKLEQKLRHTSETDMVPVWLHEPALDDPEAGLFNDQSRWRRYTEHELYQVFHYKFPEVIDGKIRSSSWDDYVRLNKAFADRVLETYQPGDIIIVHDYQLLLLPRMLRQRIGDIKICSFVHTPFPSFEYFRSLSHRDEIISGMLGADMVAFQSASFADHFRSCCQRLPLGYQASVAGVEADGRHISIEVLPMGINNDEIQQAAFDSAGLDEKMTGILQALKNTKIIVGRDRVDASRGVIQKLQAFGMLLHRYPNWRGNVTLVQVASPATIEDKERGADQTADIIADLVADLNGKFGTFGYVPVCYYTRYLPKDEYYALLRVADVGLITSVRDGMNTVSLEFAMAQKDKHGPLLLSEFSGTASYLKGAININPWDLGGTADKINAALEMPEVQRKEMYDQLLPCLEGNPVQKWVEKLLRKLLIHLEHCKATEVRPMLDVDVVKKYFATSSRRLFIFDYDGTLTPIVEDPDAALPSQDLMSSLVTLAADKRNTVWVVSGRDQAFLIKWLGSIPGLGFSAEHGSFIKYPNTDTWVDLTAGEDLGWQQLTIDAFQGVTDQLPGSVVEKKKVAITWHYRRADPDLGEMNAKALKKKLERTVAVDFDVEVMTGKANIEVRPRSINKGEVVKRLVNIFGHGPDQEPDFVLCLGDDTTDEGESCLFVFLYVAYLLIYFHRHVSCLATLGNANVENL